ncbi:hypothetical protein SLE2022_116690 [Rubroshorea leprosula]
MSCLLTLSAWLEKQSPHSREYGKVHKDVMGQAQMCQIIMYLTLTRFACNYSSTFRNMGGTLLLWELKPLIFLHIDPCGNVLLLQTGKLLLTF